MDDVPLRNLGSADFNNGSGSGTTIIKEDQVKESLRWSRICAWIVGVAAAIIIFAYGMSLLPRTSFMNVKLQEFQVWHTVGGASWNASFNVLSYATIETVRVDTFKVTVYNFQKIPSTTVMKPLKNIAPGSHLFLLSDIGMCPPIQTADFITFRMEIEMQGTIPHPKSDSDHLELKFYCHVISLKRVSNSSPANYLFKEARDCVATPV